MGREPPKSNRQRKNMKTNQPLLQRAFPRVLAWALAISLCGAMALAQDTTAAPAQENAPAAANGQRTDAQIEMDVVHALDASQALKNDLITAATIQSEVTLSGTVASESNKELANSIASQVPGVTKVHDNLKVGNPQAAQNPQDTQSPMAGDEGAPQTADNQPSAMPGPAPGQGPYNQGPYNQGPPAQGPYNRAPYNPGAPAQGPYNQGPYDQGPPAQGPYNQGPYSQGPSAQGPYNQGPYDQGPSTQGPYNQGPYNQGPPAQGPYNQGPYNQGPYAQQGQPQYAPAQRSAPAYRTSTGPVTVPQGTLLQLRTSEPVDSKRAVEGTPVQFTLIRDVTLGDVLAIPRGATVHGVVTEAIQAGPIKGSPELALTLTGLDLGGRTYPLETDQFKVKGPSKTGRTAGSAIGGALLGAIIGGAAGGGGGAAIGAVSGGTIGTAASAATPGPRAWIPAEALVTFHLAAPVTVSPVSQEEAARLAQGLNQGGPMLYRRGVRRYGNPYRNGPYAYPYGYMYGYPPVYYRPYYMMGGFYYWR